MLYYFFFLTLNLLQIIIKKILSNNSKMIKNPLCFEYYLINQDLK